MSTLGKMKIQGLMMIPLAASLMGNQSCDQKQAVQQRELKKIVGFQSIASKPVDLPGGGKFDFSYVMNNQVYGVMDQQNMYIQAASAAAIDFSQGVGEELIMLSQKDKQKLGTSYERANLAQEIYQKSQSSQESSCFVYLPQVKMEGAVFSFEMLNSVGIGIGFNPSGPLPISTINPSVDLQVDTFQLSMSMAAYRPENGTHLKDVNIDKNQTKTKVGFSLNLGMLSLSPSLFFSTPLAKVSESALTKAISTLKKGMESDQWYSRVLKDEDTHIVFLGGTNIGIKNGDRFSVYNELGYWKGEPCGSEYIGGLKGDPVAIIQVDDIGDSISAGRVLGVSEGGVEYNNSARIGAKVLLKSLVADTVAATVAKAATVGPAKK